MSLHECCRDSQLKDWDEALADWETLSAKEESQIPYSVTSTAVDVVTDVVAHAAQNTVVIEVDRSFLLDDEDSEAMRTKKAKRTQDIVLRNTTVP